MIDQFRPGYRAVVCQSHQRIDRFARITARIDRIGRDINQTELLIAFVNAGNHRLAFRLAVTIRTRKNFRRLYFRQKIRQTLRISGQCRRQKDKGGKKRRYPRPKRRHTPD
ncbi:hypothetical protein M775_11480 [Neisseria gonorrhoeae MU_NG6]|uniref:Uncharacterized protein n=1 Tax=Neisseria gonorrhoeae TaxID=485 RepID=A0AB74EHX3_NEIGO|nr:hypothetical protein M771_10035 [Neisseria gonorrhoeae MU_NG1]KLS90654.1 hypothetical protein M775_11480 [Neisseria gonorrhoeae MU_NG6]SBQ21921.1 Uncharacterised protein [Neisseria gonorrhoeae]STZ91861.1 Uncharacterised protein [Neisseria gonorrhoeae]